MRSIIYTWLILAGVVGVIIFFVRFPYVLLGVLVVGAAVVIKHYVDDYLSWEKARNVGKRLYDKKEK